MSKDIDTFSNTHIICPYCGAEVEKADYETFHDDCLETDGEFYCEECGHEFVASRSVIFCYESYKKKEEQ